MLRNPILMMESAVQEPAAAGRGGVASEVASPQRGVWPFDGQSALSPRAVILADSESWVAHGPPSLALYSGLPVVLVGDPAAAAPPGTVVVDRRELPDE